MSYCPVCGNEIVPNPHEQGGSPQIYCGETCKAAAAFARWYAKPGNAERHSKNVVARRKKK